MNVSTSRRKDRGFTLVELLIVIVILGVLATITVFAVRGIVDKGSESACAADWRNMEHAQEANMALKGVYATETELLNNELLHAESGNVDVTLTTDNYSLAYVGDCVGQTPPGDNPVSTGPVVTGPALPSNIANTTYASLPAQAWGTGPNVVLLMGTGAGGPKATAVLAALDAGWLPDPNVTIVAINASSFSQLPLAVADAIVTAGPQAIGWAGGDPTLTGGPLGTETFEDLLNFTAISWNDRSTMSVNDMVSEIVLGSGLTPRT